MRGSEFFVAGGITPGRLVRLERVRRGWRQADVAERAGVTQAEVSSLERGLAISRGVRQRIYQALELDCGEER